MAWMRKLSRLEWVSLHVMSTCKDMIKCKLIVSLSNKLLKGIMQINEDHYYHIYIYAIMFMYKSMFI
jgi:hypothetical protein